ncbi:MAG TPA: hypothetical protein VK762_16900, partial [Polyangiaceae bacterium]|nr:hypothetical protein [Polyangiaceae bacterium]
RLLLNLEESRSRGTIMETTSKKPRAVTGCTRQHSPGVLSRAKIMYTAILAAIAQLPNLPITMAAFLALIQALDTAQGNMKAKPRGLASVRDTKRDDVWTAMQTLRTYVQSLADALSAPEATALIELAGLLVAGVPNHIKPFLEAKPTTLPGVVRILANAGLLVGSSSKKTTFRARARIMEVGQCRMEIGRRGWRFWRPCMTLWTRFGGSLRCFARSWMSV